MVGSGILAKVFEDTDKAFTRNRNVFMYTLLGTFLVFSSFVAAKFPCHYLKMSSIVTGILFIPRAIHYTRKDWYLYLMDYCYIVNIAIIYLSFYGSDALTNGVLYNSTYYLLINVYRYGNSLVLHNQETFFTCYMHINPHIALAVSYLSGCIEFETNFTTLLYHSSKWYCIYAAFYFPIIFGLLKPFWTKYRIPNLFLYHSEQPFYRDLFAKMPFWGPPVYMWGLQLSMVIASSCLSYFAFQNDLVMIAVACFFLVYTIYRAGTYYIDYMPAAILKEAKKASN